MLLRLSRSLRSVTSWRGSPPTRSDAHLYHNHQCFQVDLNGKQKVKKNWHWAVYENRNEEHAYNHTQFKKLKQWTQIIAHAPLGALCTQSKVDIDRKTQHEQNWPATMTWKYLAFCSSGTALMPGTGSAISRCVSCGVKWWEMHCKYEKTAWVVQCEGNHLYCKFINWQNLNVMIKVEWELVQICSV